MTTIPSNYLQKIPFEVIACSGFDEDHPPEQLSLATTLSPGWQSERFCLFPQALILAFKPGKIRIQKLQILLHQYKIPKRIEFFIGQSLEKNYSFFETSLDSSVGLSLPDIEFKRLGFVNFQDNSKNDYKMRELKSIHLSAEGTHLKVVLDKCFINPLNLYNQASFFSKKKFKKNGIVVTQNVKGRNCRVKRYWRDY
jgi:centrosomal protein CEP104